jgi:pyruvate dehydrogenase E1 component beta subunit
MSQAMRRDPEVFIMGEDIAEMGGSMGVTQGMLAEFGSERVRNTPISEMAMVGTGMGAAIMGMRPIVEIMYEDFLTLGMEQLVNQAAKHRYMSGGQVKVPLTVRTQGGAGWSPGAQHAQQLEAWLVHVPGLKVVFASTPTDVRGLLWSAIYDDNPVVFFEHRTLYPLKEDVSEEIEPIPSAKAGSAKARTSRSSRPGGSLHEARRGDSSRRQGSRSRSSTRARSSRSTRRRSSSRSRRRTAASSRTKR